MTGIAAAFLGAAVYALQENTGSNKPEQLAQAYGSICSTPTGTCVVAPQPVGTPCTCPNGQVGTIVP